MNWFLIVSTGWCLGVDVYCQVVLDVALVCVCRAYVEEDLCAVGLVCFPDWVLYKLQNPNTCSASPGG